MPTSSTNLPTSSPSTPSRVKNSCKLPQSPKQVKNPLPDRHCRPNHGNSMATEGRSGLPWLRSQESEKSLFRLRSLDFLGLRCLGLLWLLFKLGRAGPLPELGVKHQGNRFFFCSASPLYTVKAGAGRGMVALASLIGGPVPVPFPVIPDLEWHLIYPRLFC